MKAFIAEEKTKHSLQNNLSFTFLFYDLSFEQKKEVGALVNLGNTVHLAHSLSELVYQLSEPALDAVVIHSSQFIEKVAHLSSVQKYLKNSFCIFIVEEFEHLDKLKPYVNNLDYELHFPSHLKAPLQDILLHILVNRQFKQTNLLSSASNEPVNETEKQLEQIEFLSENLMFPIEQLVQFSHIALQRMQRQQLNLAEQYLSEIKLILEELVLYIQDMKEMALLKANKKPFTIEEIDLTQLLRKIKRQFEPIASSRKITLEFVNHLSQPYALGDVAKLSKVLNLLLTNAMKVLSPGDEVFIHLNEKEAFFELKIHLSRAIFEHIACYPFFDLFTKPCPLDQKKIMSVNLSICKELMKGQNGDLELQTCFQSPYSRFMLYLPRQVSFFND